jgi:predicted nuclease of restriction endonuclease-like (RecB) superfamily
MLDSSAGYPAMVKEIRNSIRSAKYEALRAANKELIKLCWDIGRIIVEKEKGRTRGRSVIQRLSRDLRSEFVGPLVFSQQNIWSMRLFYLAWTEEVSNLKRPVGELDGKNLPQAIEEIPWGHNLQLLSALKDPMERLWYARKIIEYGWSSEVLIRQIKSGLYRKRGMARTDPEKSKKTTLKKIARLNTEGIDNQDIVDMIHIWRKRKAAR